MGTGWIGLGQPAAHDRRLTGPVSGSFAKRHANPTGSQERSASSAVAG